MKKVSGDIWSWSVFSDEKKLFFNGLYLQCPQGPVLIDPPPLADEDFATLNELGRPKTVVLTNKDHRRGSEECRKRLGTPILIHELDAPLLDLKPDGTFKNGERVAGELEVLHLPHMKSPGESALYWKKERVLVLGDALIGKPTGELGLLPAEKFADARKAVESLKKLRSLDLKMVLVGDGDSVLSDGTAALERFFTRFGQSAP